MTPIHKHILLPFTHVTPKRHINNNNSNDGNDNNDIKSALTKVPSQQLALTIPEILECILSFLTLSNRQNTARLVCKQWFAICKDLIPISYTWTLPLNLEANSTEIQATQVLVSHAQVLVINLDDPAAIKTTTICKQRLANWEWMMGILSTVTLDQERSRRHPRLRSLHLKNEVLGNWATQLPQLPFLTNLSVLRIDMTVYWHIIHLFIIFRSCPNLEELSIKPPLEATQVTPQSSSLREQMFAPMSSQERALISAYYALPTPNYLQTCSLYNIYVTLPALRGFLDASPRLSKLVLARCNFCHDDQPMDIIRLVGAHHPNLKTFHQSNAWQRAVCGYGLTGFELNAVLEAFPHGEECNITDSGMGSQVMRELRTSVVNRITTMNILPTHPSKLGHNITSHPVREILCGFPHLLHLRAPTSNYCIKDMDLCNMQGQAQNYRATFRPSSRYHSGPIPTNDTTAANQYIWACRGLRTLHLTIGYEEFNITASSKALIMFGFLSRMCPRLQELYLTVPKLDMSIPAGLCLLTRLRDLHRVRFVTGDCLQLNKCSLFWMVSSPSFTWRHVGYPLMALKIRSDLRGQYGNVQPSAIMTASSKLVERGREMGMDLSKIGYPDDLLEWMDCYSKGINTASTAAAAAAAANVDLTAAHDGEVLPMWPKLQSFWIEYRNRRTGHGNSKGDAKLKKPEKCIVKVPSSVDLQVFSEPQDLICSTTLQLF
ncbi:hypothetical protein BGZ96_004527 [Linnemannia gamsii]|uniref:F-box domain-containing protein n=1 Tax=Linnemannia gamsii TaxID=64522 RepID=A0ABQ7K5I9_9FUNG|nr:hypothetical protein BGZ96_004527 [Linnemannia gamsii]